MLATGRAESAGSSGFTLIEMLVVLAILGLVTGIAFPSVERALYRSAVQRAVTQVMGALAKTRAGAILKGQTTRLQFLPDGRGLIGFGDQEVRLPADIQLLPPSDSITFFGDGASTGGRFSLVHGASRTDIAIDPVSGLATVAPQ